MNYINRFSAQCAGYLWHSKEFHTPCLPDVSGRTPLVSIVAWRYFIYGVCIILDYSPLALGLLLMWQLRVNEKTEVKYYTKI